MARPLAPFCRHLGEARYRCRLIRIAAERIEAAALAATSPGDDGAGLAAAIASARLQLAQLEEQAARWRRESATEPARATRGDAARQEIAEFLRR